MVGARSASASSGCGTEQRQYQQMGTTPWRQQPAPWTPPELEARTPQPGELPQQATWAPPQVLQQTRSLLQCLQLLSLAPGVANGLCPCS